MNRRAKAILKINHRIEAIENSIPTIEGRKENVHLCWDKEHRAHRSSKEEEQESMISSNRSSYDTPIILTGREGSPEEPEEPLFVPDKR
jgi:hypothetical protein